MQWHKLPHIASLRWHQAAASRGGGTCRRGEGGGGGGWSTGSTTTKSKHVFVIVSNGLGWFVFGPERRNMEDGRRRKKAATPRNMMRTSDEEAVSSVAGQRRGFYFPSGLKQRTNWASLKHKIEQQSMRACQYASGRAQTWGISWLTDGQTATLLRILPFFLFFLDVSDVKATEI